MKTISLSPARRAGLVKQPTKSPKSGGCTIPHPVGSHVVDRRDPRHVAEVLGYPGGYVASVRFIETGWRGQIPINYLELVASG